MSSAGGATRGRAALVVLLLGGLALLAGVPTWVRAGAVSVLGPELPVTVTGSTAAPAVAAAGLVLLAAGAAVGLVGRAGRWVVVLVVAFASVVVTVSAAGVLRAPATAARAAAAELTGVAELAGAAHTTPAVWCAAVLGVLGVLVAAWLARTSRAWSAGSRRHERTRAAHGDEARPAEVPDDAALWDAQTRGEDRS